ncbi:MAG: NTP transferase domain-containing protein [Candidatus Hodarchaeales archaeon]|jgi:molybdopterin-guanine dinucleotide biosynthesis protein A
MEKSDNTVGILWMGGKSRRFHDPLKPAKRDKNKIYHPLQGKSLFLWVFENINSVVNNIFLSFHSFDQFEHFKKYIERSSIILPHYDKIFDSSNIKSKGPLQAQLTVLQKQEKLAKVITTSADMPFIPSSLFKSLLNETAGVCTLQSSEKILEPLVSAYSLKECSIITKFLSRIPFGRADDIHRAVEDLTLLTIPTDFPSVDTPWNTNINFKHEIDNLNRKSNLSTSGITKLIDIDKINKHIIKNPGNNLKSLTNYLEQLNFGFHTKKSSSRLLEVFEGLSQLRSFFWEGRFAELLGHSEKNKNSQFEWFSRSAESYWNETNFWMKKDVPFIAIHSLKDALTCVERNDEKTEWFDEANLLHTQLREYLNLRKGSL